MEAYSEEFRRDVLAACDAGAGTREVALRFSVSESWVRRIKQERREQGKVAPQTTRQRRKSWEPHAAWILAKLDAQPDIYLRELQAAALEERGWVEQHLVSALRPGDVVVMDNLSSHKVKGVVEAIAAVGAEVRYLPPYSPDLNPIELAFSKFKKLLRDGAERTAEKLEQLCGRVLELFNEHECRNYLKHCGYRYG